ncbi:hypothetical protein Tco_1039083, partial [Tanacetum coccineum]
NCYIVEATSINNGDVANASSLGRRTLEADVADMKGINQEPLEIALSVRTNLRLPGISRLKIDYAAFAGLYSDRIVDTAPTEHAYVPNPGLGGLLKFSVFSLTKLAPKFEVSRFNEFTSLPMYSSLQNRYEISSSTETVRRQSSHSISVDTEGLPELDASGSTSLNVSTLKLDE